MKNSLGVSLVYFMFGVFWVIFSDALVFKLISSNVYSAKNIQNIKGLIFVLLSGVLIFLFTNFEYKKLLSKNSFIKNTFSNLPLGVVVNRLKDGKITLVNNHFTKIFGWESEELTTLSDFLKKVFPDAEYRKKIRNKVVYDIQNKASESLKWNNILITTKTNERKRINVKRIPVFGQRLVMLVANDVTREQQYVETIEEQNKKLREITWMQSHMLRAPVARIAGLASLMRGGKHRDDQEKIIDKLMLSAEELDKITREVVQKSESINATSNFVKG